MNGRLALVFAGGMAFMVLLVLAWLWMHGRKAWHPEETGTYHDPLIAAVADPAARAMLDQLAGRIRQAAGDLAYLQNVAEDAQRRSTWAVLRPGNPYDADAALGRDLVRGKLVAVRTDPDTDLPLSDPRD